MDKQNSIYSRENQKCDLPYADSELAYNRSDSALEEVKITIGWFSDSHQSVLEALLKECEIIW